MMITCENRGLDSFNQILDILCYIFKKFSGKLTLNNTKQKQKSSKFLSKTEFCQMSLGRKQIIEKMIMDSNWAI